MSACRSAVSVDDRINQNGNVGVSNDRFALGSLFRLRPRIPSISAALPDQTPWDGQATGGSCCSHHARFKGGLCGWKSVGLWVNVQKTLEKLGCRKRSLIRCFSRENRFRLRLKTENSSWLLTSCRGFDLMESSNREVSWP